MKLLKFSLLVLLLSSANADFIQKSENVLKDNTTNVLWQDSKDAKSKTFTHQEAISYCNNLDLDGEKNWKLPGFMELFSLVNTKSYNPTAFKEFKYIASANYWSSKVFSHSVTNEAFVIDFKSGAFNRNKMSDKFYVRCYKDLKN